MSLCPRTFLGAFHHAVFISALWSWGWGGRGSSFSSYRLRNLPRLGILATGSPGLDAESRPRTALPRLPAPSHPVLRAPSHPVLRGPGRSLRARATFGPQKRKAVLLLADSS